MVLVCLRFFRFHDELHASIERQELRSGDPDIGGRQGVVAGKVVVEPAGVAGFREVGVELVGLAAESADALEALVERRLDLVDRTLEFVRRRRLALQRLDLLVDHFLHLGDRVPRSRRCDDLERRGEGGRLLGRPDVLRNLHVVDEAFVEARVLAAGQNVRHHVERGVARLEVTRRQPREVQPRQLHAIGDRFLLHARERHRRNGQRSRRGRTRHVAEPLLDEPPCGRHVQVAGDDQARVGRGVIGFEKRHHVVVAGRGEVRHVPDDRPVVWMTIGILHFIEDDLGRAIRPVLDRLAPFVFHHVALGVDRFRRHRFEEVPHAIGLEEQRELDGVRWDVNPVVRAVVRRGPVVVPAGGFEPLVEFPWLHVARTHEHQMLEQMREAGPTRAFTRRADVVPHVHGDDRHAVIFMQDDVQTVGERELHEGDVDRRGGDRARRRLPERGRGQRQHQK